MRRIKEWIGGYLVVCLLGKFPERFFNLCAANGIRISKSYAYKEYYLARMSLADYRRIGPIARKSGVLPLIYKRKGLPFVCQWAKKHTIFLLGLTVAVLLMLALQTFLWDISVYGNYMHSEEQIVGFLRENGILSGCRLEEISCQEIETMLRNEFDDIIWVSAELKGTRLFLHVKEAYQYPTHEVSGWDEGNIVATKSGVVESIVVRNGIPLVSEGDTVQAGDVLVSGVIERKNAYDELLETIHVLADADVMVRYSVEYQDSFAMTNPGKVYTGKEKRSYRFSIFGYEILQYASSNSYENCDIITTYADLRLLHNLYLPVQWVTVVSREYEQKDITYTEDEARALALKRYLQFLDRLLQDGCTLLEEELRVQIAADASVCEAASRVVVLASAWEYQNIPEEVIDPEAETPEE